MFNTTVLSLPQTVPYLRAYPDDVNFWRERLVGQPKGLKVGLAWTGRVDHRSDRNRATELGMWKTVFQISGVRFFSLHKTESSPDSSSSAKVEGLVDWTCELNDFADTAALISNLDLVISVDTATAHLAGALGKPVWTLLRTAADWRWLRNRDDSPWYPTMRLFRQSSRGDWREVVERIAKALSELGSL